MQRYFLCLSYNGRAYCGWQEQPNGISIQHSVSQTISTILRHKTAVTGAGRTDAGVHAKLMVAHFDAEEMIEDSNKFLANLNSFLPSDIAVFKLIKVKSGAHARFDALSRKYEYHLITYKSPFLVGFAYRFVKPLDFDLMNKAAKLLFDYRDFTSFSKLHTDVKTNNCVIKQAYWEKRGEEWVFIIEADRFLRNMVRAIVGTLLDVGIGKLSLKGFREVVESKNRCNAGHSVPACGLYLTDITYPEELFEGS